MLAFPSMNILECIIFLKKNYEFLDNCERKHLYNTRHKELLYAQVTKLTKINKSVFNNIIRLYNHLPVTIRDLPLNKLKNKFKMHFIKKAFYNVEEYFHHSFDE